ncbi:hypothetical protein TSUD_354660 [Trifolium subterraneum]|uniref:Uncharacterized protein n=1 Tax=Trifolium subterraneum TaxID=3900 RepID=A0A2Z6P0Z2_TRISU|nr:hypothetical protein TSUD_354660 [Trifolium subterraneum]
MCTNHMCYTLTSKQSRVATSKQSRVATHMLGIVLDVIDIDDDDESDDLMIIGEDVSKSNKGKTIEVIPEVVPGVDYMALMTTLAFFCKNILKINFTSGGFGGGRGVIIIDFVNVGFAGAESGVCDMNKSGGSGGGRDAGDGAKMISDSEFRFGSSDSRSWTVILVLVSATTKLKETVVAVLNTEKLIGNPGEVVNMSDEVVVVVVEGSGSGLNIHNQMEKKLCSGRSTFESNTWYDTQPAATNINTRKPTSSTNFQSATKASSVYNSSSMNQTHLDNINISIGLSSFGSSTLYGTQSEATNMGVQFSSSLFYQATPNKRKSTAPTLPTSANSRSAKKSRLNNVDIATPNRRKTTAPTTSANFRSAKKAQLDNVGYSYGIGSSASHSYSGASSMRLLPAATKKAVSIGSKNSRATSSSKPYQSLDFGASMRMITASKPSAATKTVSGKKAAGSGSKNSQATSSSKSSQSFGSGNSKIQESIMDSPNLQIKNFDHSSEILMSSFKSSSPSSLMGSSLFSHGSKISNATSSSKPSQD